MPARPPTVRFALYALLGAASVVFLAPFAWMIVTSLKPIEQAMSLPPDWIPREYDAVLDGRRMEVTKDYVLRQAGEVVELSAGEEAGRRVFLSAQQVAAGAGG